MTIESMMTAKPPKVTGWRGLSDAGHFELLKTALFRTRGRARFNRAAADRILDDLRHVAYRNGVAAARVFQFLDQDYIDADDDLSSAQEDLNRISRNLPFLREVAAVVEEIESIQDEMSEEARIFFGWRPYAGKWAFPNPVWSELRTAFQEGRDDAERSRETIRCPAFVTEPEPSTIGAKSTTLTLMTRCQISLRIGVSSKSFRRIRVAWIGGDGKDYPGCVPAIQVKP